MSTNSADRTSIPAHAVLPQGWSANPDTLHRDFSRHFHPEFYGIPPATPIAESRDDLTYLMDCESQYLMYYGINDKLVRIDHPTKIDDVLKAMVDIESDIKFTDLDQLPDGLEYNNTFGWSFESDTLHNILHQMPAQVFGLTHLTPVMTLPEKGILLFRQDFKDRIWDQDWKYYIWDQHSIHLVHKPTTLEEIVHTLMHEGFTSNENLSTTELSHA